jgi:predicted O-methyltransferase YrrM
MGLRTWLGLKRRPEPAAVVRADWRDVPWLTDGAVDFLDGFLSTLPQARVLEFGTGASTLWFARRGVSILSFDHDPAWHASVRKILPATSAIDLRLHARPYYEAVAGLPSGSFDLVLVDGRDRVACVRHAMRLVEPGKFLMIDNTERIPQGRYEDIPNILEGWSRQDFEQHGPDRTGWQFVHPEGRWITSVWQRPPN